MMWGGIAGHQKAPLVVVDVNLTARRYINDILAPHAISWLNRHPEVHIFQRDNARPRAARIARPVLQENWVIILPWPPYSPDEHLWDLLGQRLASRPQPPHNRLQLITALQEEWDNIPAFRIRRLVRSMRRRCAQCPAARGGHTRY
jgi:hypothetical protein